MAIEYLTALEGPFWKNIRGLGLSYSYSITASPEEARPCRRAKPRCAGPSHAYPIRSDPIRSDHIGSYRIGIKPSRAEPS